MGNDLQVAGVTLPPTVAAPCPLKVSVDVINRGPDPAHFPAPGMTICLDIAVGDQSVHYSITTAIEEPALPSRAVRTFTFTGVQFPCAPSATLTVTADCAVSVPDNARTNPSLTVSVPNIQLVPWLWTDQLRVGLRDSTGYITWDPGALCPGAELVAEAVIRNAGCAVAVASVTTLELLDGNGQSVAVLNQNTPSIARGVSLIARFATAVPAAVAGQTLTIRACADATHVVTKQCDRQHACVEISKPLPTGFPAPTLTLSVARPIFPGEPVQISWQMDNSCLDLGEITARLLFQGVELHRSVPIAVGLQDRPKGESDLLITPSPAQARPFYTFGVKQLTLEVIGTGTDPGPYRTNATVTVMPEPTAGSWAFTMPAPGSVIAWKGAYTVAGRLTNPTHATVSPSSLVLDETSTVGLPIERNASPIIGPLTPGAVGTEAWSVIQSWSWLIPGVWVPSGPQGGLFTYTVTFAMQDEFGNAYPASTSGTLALIVQVSTKKIALGASALAAEEIGVTLLALAFIALAGYYTAVGAPALFAAAAAAFAAAAALEPEHWTRRCLISTTAASRRSVRRNFPRSSRPNPPSRRSPLSSRCWAGSALLTPR
jgi:hypothetical protein